MGLGVQTSAYPVFSDGPSGVSIGTSDMNRNTANFKRLAQPVAGRFLSYETKIAAAGADGSTWYTLRYNAKQYDIDAEGGILSPDLAPSGSGYATRFNINTSGLYLVQATERGSSASSGWIVLGLFLVGGSQIDEGYTNFLGLQPWDVRFSTTVYLAAGQQIYVQHMADASQDINLQTSSPGPFLAITRLQSRDLA